MKKSTIRTIFYNLRRISGRSPVLSPAKPGSSQRISFINSFNRPILDFVLSCNQGLFSPQCMRITIIDGESTAGHSVSWLEFSAHRSGPGNRQGWGLGFILPHPGKRLGGGRLKREAETLTRLDPKPQSLLPRLTLEPSYSSLLCLFFFFKVQLLFKGMSSLPKTFLCPALFCGFFLHKMGTDRPIVWDSWEDLTR